MVGSTEPLRQQRIGIHYNVVLALAIPWDVQSGPEWEQF
jgi:hypothetical protein